MAIPSIGKSFTDIKSFMAYLDGLQFGAWRPRFVVTHHCGEPSLATWESYRRRKIGVEQWLRNLAEYYGKSGAQGGPGDGPWQHGPHFMFTPDGYGVLSPPTVRGTHAKSFNAVSWCVEMVGDFDSEPFDGLIRDKYVDGLAALHICAGLQTEPYQRGVRGLHFHRDDPLTSKTCPGLHVKKPDLIQLIEKRMMALNGGEHPSDVTRDVKTETSVRTGTATIDGLNVRAGAGAKNPVTRTLQKGEVVSILAEAMNGTTKWLRIGEAEWVSAGFIRT